MDGESLVGDLSLTVRRLVSDDFSFGETNLSSCSRILEAILLDFEGTVEKLVLGTALSPFSDNALCLGSPNDSGFHIEDDGFCAASELILVPRIEEVVLYTGELKPLEDRRLGF